MHEAPTDRETHEYARLSAKLVLNWFIFFGTTNVAAIGFLSIAYASIYGGAEAPIQFAAVPAVFVLTSLLGIATCSFCLGHIESAGKRLEIAELMPVRFYRYGLVTMGAAALVYLLFWTGALVYLIRDHGELRLLTVAVISVLSLLAAVCPHSSLRSSAKL